MSVPRSIRDLLETRIDSFEKLDVIVALQGAPHQTMTVDALVQALGIPRDDIRQAVGQLRRGLLVDLDASGEVRLLPPTEADRESIRELAELYGEDRAPVLRLLGEIALERIRNMAARTFADAFLIGKKKGDGDG
jgi:hypothetical protein